MNSKTPVKVALAGCGGISHSHMAGLRQHPELEVVACADIREESARAWAEKYGVPKYFTDWRQLVEQVRPEVLIFATWPSQHLEQITGAAELRVPAILCEKALALTEKDGAAMAAACRKSGSLLMEAFMYRHAPRTIDFMKRIRSGELGELRCVRAVFSAPIYNPKGSNWRNVKETGGGIAYDFTCYGVNLLRAAFGQSPKRVSALAEICPEQNIIVTLHGFLDYGGGRVGHIESSQKEAWRMEAEAIGANGILNFPLFILPPGDQSAPLRLTQGNGWGGDYRHTEFAGGYANPYGLQALNLAKALQEKTSLELPVEESVENLHTMDALLKAADTGQWVTLG